MNGPRKASLVAGVYAADSLASAGAGEPNEFMKMGYGERKRLFSPEAKLEDIIKAPEQVKFLNNARKAKYLFMLVAEVRRLRGLVETQGGSRGATSPTTKGQ